VEEPADFARAFALYSFAGTTPPAQQSGRETRSEVSRAIGASTIGDNTGAIARAVHGSECFSGAPFKNRNNLGKPHFPITTLCSYVCVKLLGNKITTRIEVETEEFHVHKTHYLKWLWHCFYQRALFQEIRAPTKGGAIRKKAKRRRRPADIAGIKQNIEAETKGQRWQVSC
jgi:hypothetical protein